MKTIIALCAIVLIIVAGSVVNPYVQRQAGLGRRRNVSSIGQPWGTLMTGVVKFCQACKRSQGQWGLLAVGVCDKCAPPNGCIGNATDYVVAPDGSVVNLAAQFRFYPQ